jgi:excinuclease UvrABC helicase subunit UvrB
MATQELAQALPGLFSPSYTEYGYSPYHNSSAFAKEGSILHALLTWLSSFGIAALRSGFKRRVLVSTDLTARGVDLERVNLVVNLDLPYEAATLLHRIGRTGRWGSRGVAVTFCVGEELQRLRDLIEEVSRHRTRSLQDCIHQHHS